MKLWTDAIDLAGNFDPRYTCDVDNSSPELRWTEIPEGTHSFALIAEELSPGGFVHWVVYQIPPHVLHLPAGIPPQDILPNGIRQGLNGSGKLGYSGPCPPRGAVQPMASVLTLYALDQPVETESRLRREQLLSLIQGHILAQAELRGRYFRQIERAV
jgi:Raf kinase inhibitor-like YbhB/YbcL family protein